MTVGVKTRPFKSPLRYPGGKQKALAQIAAMLPRQAKEYREPMVGGGSVFLYARSIALAKRYWINDRFEELSAFWRTVKDPKLCRRLMDDLLRLHESFSSPAQIHKYFLRMKDEQPVDEYDQARLFFFFNRVTFSGTTRAGGFSSAASLKRFTVSSIDRLKAMPEALADVKITTSDCLRLIEQPGEDVFMFLDPPYYQASKLYGRGGELHEFDHGALAAALEKTRHKFLITYDDCREIRKLYGWAKIRPFNLQYGMNNCNIKHESKLGNEIFLSNY